MDFRGVERHASVKTTGRSGFSQVVLFDDEPRPANAVAVVPPAAGVKDEGPDRSAGRAVLKSLLGAIPVYASSREGVRRLRTITALTGCAAVFTPLVMALVDPAMVFLGLPALIQDTLHEVAGIVEISSMMAVSFILLLNSSPDYRRFCRLGLEHEEMGNTVEEWREDALKRCR